MTIAGIRYPRAVLATLVSLTALCSAARAAPPADFDAATEKVREVLRQDGASSTWGADPPAQEIADRGEPFAVTVLSGAGHSLLAFDSEGRPLGSHLFLLHVRVEGSVASANECELRLGKDDDRSCPPAPMAVVDCAAWSVPVETVRAAMLAARAALFVRVYEKKFIPDPLEEIEYDGPIEGGIGGSVAGGSTADFVAVANVRESVDHPIRVVEEWAGDPSPSAAGRYARAVAAERILWDAFRRPKDAPSSAPPPAAHAEFSRLFAKLPLDSGSWWWVRERMILMASSLGLPADLARLKKNLDMGSGNIQTYSLEALARRTGRDPRCDGGRRVTDAVAAAAWKRAK
ncbi:MAG TPA: hypothetical protein VF173_13720 [Thermoanaerobaculia bacterium]|nr:hypothetical protein [Thermoanaerobaculia bacterium]